MRKIILIILCIGLLFVGCKDDDSVDNEVANKDLIEVSDLDAISDNPTEVITPKLELQDDWIGEIENNYMYIKGNVKNVGSINIRYFKVVVEFSDEDGNVLDTDYANSIEIIKPNNMKSFEIMHEFNPEYYSSKVYIEEVKAE